MVKMALKVHWIERYQLLIAVALMATIILFVSGSTCYLARAAGKGTETSVKESLEESTPPKPVIKIYRIDYYDPYTKGFPENFDYYRQLINIEQVDEGWIISSEVLPGKLLTEGEYVKNPYVRLIHPETPLEIARLTVYRGRIDKEKNTAMLKENSLRLSQLPASYEIYIGYEGSYGSGQDERSYFKEFDLDLGMGLAYRREDYTVEFIYRKLPRIHFAEYGQMVALFKSKEKSVLWSRIFGGELVMGDDYVLNPYVKLVDSKEREVAKLLIYEGKIGGKVSVHGPRESSVNIPELPLEYKVYIGYEYYHDATHREEAGGPLEIEIGQISQRE